MKTRILTVTEKRQFDADLAVQLTYADVAALGAATDGAAINLASVLAGTRVKVAGMILSTPFDCSGTGNLTVSIGDGGSETRYTAATQVALDNTEILYSAGNGTAYAYLVDDTVDAFFDSTGVNLDTYTAGELWVYLAVADLNKLPKG